MRAKDFLSRAYMLDQRIRAKLEQIKCIRSLATQASSSFGGEKVSHDRNIHSIEDAVLRIVALEESLGHQIAELIDSRKEINSVIEQISKEKYRLILEKRYLCFLTWDQIAADMNYTRRWILRCHKFAVEEVDALLANREVTP